MEYLVKNTTREQRKNIVKKAFAISVASNEIPSKEIIELSKKYIEGEIELEELQKKVIERYKKI